MLPFEAHLMAVSRPRASGPNGEGCRCRMLTATARTLARCSLMQAACKEWGVKAPPCCLFGEMWRETTMLVPGSASRDVLLSIPNSQYHAAGA